MGIGRNKNNGLDLSGVGKSSRKISGGRARNKSGYAMPPHSALGSSNRNSNIMSKSNFKGAMVGRPQRRLSSRTLITIALVVVFAFALAFSVGYMVYQQTVRNALKADLSQTALSAVLKPVEEADGAYWTVVVDTNADSAEVGRGELSQLALMYADPGNKSLSFLWIPLNTRVYIDGYGYRTIAEAFELGGEAVVCDAAAKLANVDVAHYLEANQNGLHKLEEQLGVTAEEAPADNPTAVVAALAKKLFGASNEQMVTRAGYFSSCIATDMDEAGVEAACLALQGMDTDAELYSEQMPSKSEDHDGTTYTVADTAEWSTMVTRVSNGMSPVASNAELGNYAQIRSNNVVDIWNGVGVNGVAGDCAEVLQECGWNIETTGNAAQFVYEETLVVYKDNDDEEAAQLLVSDLGQGRVVRSAYRYSYTGDILVVVGKNYQPH